MIELARKIVPVENCSSCVEFTLRNSDTSDLLDGLTRIKYCPKFTPKSSNEQLKIMEFVSNF